MVEESFVVSCLIEFLIFPSGRDQLGKMMKLDVNGKLLSTFSHSFLFTQDFGQLKAWPILDLTNAAKLSLCVIKNVNILFGSISTGRIA